MKSGGRYNPGRAIPLFFYILAALILSGCSTKNQAYIKIEQFRACYRECLDMAGMVWCENPAISPILIDDPFYYLCKEIYDKCHEACKHHLADDDKPTGEN